MDNELQDRLTQIEERLNQLGRLITSVKQDYEKVLVEIQILRDGGNI